MTSSLTSRLLRATLLAAGLLALAATPALARHHRHRPLAPPGNSGINQYVESYPTASGNQPTNRVHRHNGSHGSGPTAGAGGGGGGGGGTGGGGGVSNATASALAAQGPSGAAAASLAQATAPSHPRVHRQPVAGPRVIQGNPVAAVGGSPSAASSIFKALTGSSTSGGLGLLLPVLLIIALVGAAGLAVLRHRRASRT
jgi:hypothetical protein